MISIIVVNQYVMVTLVMDLSSEGGGGQADNGHCPAWQPQKNQTAYQCIDPIMCVGTDQGADVGRDDVI